MVDTTVHAPAPPIAPSDSADDSGHDSGVESTAIAASSPTRGATRMAVGGDSQTHRLLQEDDRD
jgi:hypothetical protein